MEIETDAAGGRWAVMPLDVLDGTVDAMGKAFDRLAAKLDPGGLAGLRLRIPQGEGSGHWDIVRLSASIYVLAGTVEYHQTRRIFVADSQTVKVRILLSGQLLQLSSGVLLNGTGAFVEAFPTGVESNYELTGGEQVRLLVLMCAPEFFTTELGLAAEALPLPLAHVFHRGSRETQGSIVPLGPDILRAANDILRSANSYPPNLRAAWLRAKTSEIACTMIADLTRQGRTPALVAVRASVRDVNRVNEARDILLDQYQRPPKIPQLARMVGINQTKLKALFKATFGATVHEFTQRCRMERALDLLTTTDIGISEIAYMLGYDYPASFTHAFKQFYGHAPKKTRQTSEPGR